MTFLRKQTEILNKLEYFLTVIMCIGYSLLLVAFILIVVLSVNFIL